MSKMVEKIAEWMPLRLQIWRKGTAFFSPAERGAYMDLILAYWELGPLPAEDDVLQQLARVPDLKTWRQVRGKVLAKFNEKDGVLYHARIDEERTVAVQKYERRANAGSAGGKASVEAKAKQPSSNASSNASPIVEANAQASAQAKINTTYQVQSPNGDIPPSEGADAPLKERIFGPALSWLAKQTRKDPNKLRSVVGKWCSQYGDGPTLDALNAASKNAPLDPIPYIERVLKPKPGKPDAKQNFTDHLAGIASALGAGTMGTVQPEPIGEGRVIDGDCRVVGPDGTGQQRAIRGGNGEPSGVRGGVRDQLPSPGKGAGNLPGNAQASASRSTGEGDSAAENIVDVGEPDAVPSRDSDHGSGRLRKAAIAALAGEASDAEGPGDGWAEERDSAGAMGGTAEETDQGDDLSLPAFLDVRHKLRA